LIKEGGNEIQVSRWGIAKNELTKCFVSYL
jgi:hypothetical protein